MTPFMYSSDMTSSDPAETSNLDSLLHFLESWNPSLRKLMLSCYNRPKE